MKNGKAGAPPLPRDAQTRIGLKLKALYNDVANEPVPDRFRQLLEDLERRSDGSASAAAPEDHTPTPFERSAGP